MNKGRHYIPICKKCTNFEYETDHGYLAYGCILSDKWFARNFPPNKRMFYFTDIQPPKTCPFILELTLKTEK